ncbi:MAG TPA: pyrroline-5-carboxylate reductase [Psychromonas hadalis]|nr:pyrroline-5-carboxylate reductase [Psychromonas hadalis]
MQNKKITFIGAGNMASSIITGLVNNGYDAKSICACAPSKNHTQQLADSLNITISDNNAESVEWAEVIILGVKPQIMADVCQQLVDSGVGLSSKLFISIAAGISVQRLQSILGKQTNIIRTMPNTPSLVQKGMTGLFADNQINPNDKAFAEQLMQAVGETLWVEKEAMINAIIAASGSAPAYFFLFLEAMQNKAIALGFDEDQARLLVLQSALGSAEMVKQNPAIDLATLRQNVTSKGGTTEQAVNALIETGLVETVNKAMQAACDKGAAMEKTL